MTQNRGILHNEKKIFNEMERKQTAKKTKEVLGERSATPEKKFCKHKPFQRVKKKTQDKKHPGKKGRHRENIPRKIQKKGRKDC